MDSTLARVPTVTTMQPAQPDVVVDPKAGDSRSLVSFWSVVPIFLKPDAIAGDFTKVPGKLAADFAKFLAAALDGLGLPLYEPYFSTSPLGAERARERVIGESAAFDWYVLSLKHVGVCQRRLEALHLEWARCDLVEIVDVVCDACGALGFNLLMTSDRVVTRSDYMAFYGATREPDMHEKMMKYLIGKPIRILLLCGQQENSALHILKTYLRRVMRYPTKDVEIENWLHVTNPDDPNYARVVAMCASG